MCIELHPREEGSRQEEEERGEEEERRRKEEHAGEGTEKEQWEELPDPDTPKGCTKRNGVDKPYWQCDLKPACKNFRSEREIIAHLETCRQGLSSDSE